MFGKNTNVDNASQTIMFLMFFYIFTKTKNILFVWSQYKGANRK